MPPPLPIVYVLSCHNLHVRLSNELMNIIDSVAKRERSRFTVTLMSFADEHSDEIMVSMKQVMLLATAMKNVSSHISLQSVPECVDTVLAFELGKLSQKITSEDKVVILSDSDIIYRTFNEATVGSGVVAKVCSMRYLEDINSVAIKR